MFVRFMSYNVCSGRNFNKDKKINILDAGDVIRKYNPDVVGLNEVRGLGSIEDDYNEQVKCLGEALGYNYFFSKAIDFKEGPYGNGLLSRFPIINPETIPIPDPENKDEDCYYETRGVLKGKLKISDTKSFNVYVSHFGLANSEKENAVKTVVDLIKDEKDPFIFMGDLNMEPEDGRLKPIYDLMRDTEFPGRRREYLSFTSWDPKIKIDYIFYSGNFECVYSFVPPETTSDHRPCIADIKMDLGEKR